jgi:hypothetical protein
MIARLLLSDSLLKHTIEEKLCHTSWPVRYESIVTQNEDLHKPPPTKSICEAKFSDEMGAVCVTLSFCFRPYRPLVLLAGGKLASSLCMLES